MDLLVRASRSGTVPYISSYYEYTGGGIFLFHISLYVFDLPNVIKRSRTVISKPAQPRLEDQACLACGLIELLGGRGAENRLNGCSIPCTSTREIN